ARTRGRARRRRPRGVRLAPAGGRDSRGQRPAGGWPMTAAAMGGGDEFAPDRALWSSGLLGEFNAAGVLSAADVHVAAALGRLGGETDETVLLAAALTVRGTRHGSVMLDLSTVAEQIVPDDPERDDAVAPAPPTTLPWPDPVA